MARLLEHPKPGKLPPIKYVQVMTHNRCNADCVFCPYSESAHAAVPAGKMTDAMWHHVLNNLQPFRHGIEAGKFCPYLMQEPLIDVSIFSKIDDIYRCFPKTQVEISTNGAALTAKTVDKLLERFIGRRHELWVSHHGVDKETMEHIMQIDYDKATANLVHLIKTSNGRCQIKIRGAGESQFGKRIYFTRQQYLDYWKVQAKTHDLNMKNVSIDAFSFHDRAGGLHRPDRGANELNSGKVRDIGPGHKPFYCPRIDEWVHIRWNGDIVICCMDYAAEVKLPNLDDVWLVDYFFSKEYRDLVDMVSGRVESPENLICKRCHSPGG